METQTLQSERLSPLINQLIAKSNDLDQATSNAQNLRDNLAQGYALNLSDISMAEQYSAAVEKRNALAKEIEELTQQALAVYETPLQAVAIELDLPIFLRNYGYCLPPKYFALEPIKNLHEGEPQKFRFALLTKPG